MATKAEEAMKAGLQIDCAMYEGRITSTWSLPHLQTMKTRRVRPDDIYLSTYAKSGTHWIWELVSMVVAGEATYMKHWQNQAFLEYRSEVALEELSSPRVFFTHMFPGMLPDDVWKKKCHVINMRRNPKDAIVSFFEQQTNQNWVNKDPDKPFAFTGTWDSYVDSFIRGTVLFDSIFDHIHEWNSVPETHPGVPFLQVHFEQLKENDTLEVKKIAEFLGRPLSEELCEEIAEACRFNKLKHANEHLKEQTFHNTWRPGSTGYFRKGEVGEWKTRFTVDQSERFDKEWERKFGSRFPY